MLKLFRPLLSGTIRRFSGKKDTDLKAILACKIEAEREKVKKFAKEHGKVKLGEVTIGAVYGGMRGITGLLCDTSAVDPEKGITFRGLTIPQVQEALPKAEDGEQPLPEGLFWLLLTGDVPDCSQVFWLSEEWARRSKLPKHVDDFLTNVPKTVHPMAQFSAACTILSSDSKFVQAYTKGVPKTEYWEYYYEDAMDLIGKVTVIAAKIYRNSFKKDAGKIGNVDKDRDWSHNFCCMLGFDDPEFLELMRMYLTIHSDHEGGNVSAHTVHLVGSALSDAYLSFAAGMNGLAGPLHGLANQEVLVWLMKLKEELGEKADEKQLTDFVWKTLKSGQVIPGYGHAVLRKTDPRYVCQREFALKHLPEDPMFQIVSNLYEVVPKVLTELGKVKNPWPNVDAHSGVLLQYYCMTEMSYYTVLFGVSRALGVLSSLIWHRALVLPIERPKSISTSDLQKKAGVSSC